MDDHNQKTNEIRKEWVSPDLKKIDIEEITANGFMDSSDGDGPGTPDPS